MFYVCYRNWSWGCVGWFDGYGFLCLFWLCMDDIIKSELKGGMIREILLEYWFINDLIILNIVLYDL